MMMIKDGLKKVKLNYIKIFLTKSNLQKLYLQTYEKDISFGVSKLYWDELFHFQECGMCPELTEYAKVTIRTQFVASAEFLG